MYNNFFTFNINYCNIFSYLQAFSKYNRVSFGVNFIFKLFGAFVHFHVLHKFFTYCSC